MLKIIFLTLTIFIFAIATNAQSNSGDDTPNATLYTCEEFSARVDTIYNIAKTSQKKVFVIFHAGSNESEIVNARRLAYVRDYLRSDSKQWNELDVIYARGTKSSGKAVIAFYVDGNLIEAMSAPRNMSPCMDCCEARYYTPQNLLKPVNLKAVKAREFKRN